MGLDEVADELYGLLPGDFVAARTEAARRARVGGDRALSREIAALGRPSTAAWACNALVREHPAEIAGLVELGDLLREAQAGLAGDQLRALGRQRSRLLAALTRQARVLAARLGHPLSDAVADQVEQTLRTAMADPGAGESLLAGRLTGVLTARDGGLGTARPDLRVVPPVAARAPAVPPEEARRRAAAAERRQRELATARDDAEAAADLADEAARAARTARDRAGRAQRRAADLAARAEELAAELERVREEAAAAGTEADATQRRAAAADRAAQRAAGERDRAAARVAELEAAPGD